MQPILSTGVAAFNSDLKAFCVCFGGVVREVADDLATAENGAVWLSLTPAIDPLVWALCADGTGNASLLVTVANAWHYFSMQSLGWQIDFT
jgi:hypothetical protein